MHNASKQEAAFCAVSSKLVHDAGPPVAQAGSWKVVGNSGAVAIHALPFTNELMLLLSRPTNYAGGGDAFLTNYLTVCHTSFMCQLILHTHVA